MSEELNLHLRKLQNRAALSLTAILSTMFSIGFGILFLFVPSFIAVVFFATALISIAYLIYNSRSAKRESKEKVYEPVKFTAHKNFSFSEIICIFENLTNKENQFSTSEDVRFYRFYNIFKLRVVLYRTATFTKKEFDNAKDGINKKANKDLKISHWVNRMEAGKMMRFNITYTDTLNEALYQLISQNANENLTRVEGIINIAIVGNQIIIPPLYGNCDLAEITRYKGVIKFINNVLLSTTAE